MQRLRSWILVCVALGLLSSTVRAENDPFSALFGESEIDASEDDRANADNALILSLKVRDYLIDDGWIAYDTAEGLCIPVEAFTQALAFPITYEADQASGWVLDESAPISFALSQDNGFKNTSTGWCARIEKLEALFPLSITYSGATLGLIVEPLAVLPFEAKLERESIRKLLDKQTIQATTQYRAVDNPYTWVSWPAIDLGFSSRITDNNTVDFLADIDMAGDFLKMTGYLKTIVDEDMGSESIRLALSRQSAKAQLLGPLKLNQVKLGDVSVTSQPLLKRTTSGRGLLLSNMPWYVPDLFDKTYIRGDLREGWEAELYKGSTLLYYVTTPNENGEYEFRDIPVNNGYNRYTVKLYGPRGETEERAYVRYVGSESVPDGAFRYKFGIVDPTVSALGDSLTNTSEASQAPEQTKRLGQHVFASADYGLSRNHSIRADVLATDDQMMASMSLLSSTLGGYGALRVGHDESGHTAAQLLFQRPWSDRSNFGVHISDYGGFKTGLNGYGNARIRRSINANVSTYLPVFSSTVALFGEFSWRVAETGSEQLLGTIKASGYRNNTRWRNTLRYSRGPSGKQELIGELLLSKNLGTMRLRSSLLYQLVDKPALQGMSLSVQRSLAKNTNLQGAFNYDMAGGNTSFEVSLSRTIGAVAISAFSQTDMDDQWSAGLNISLALFRDPQQKRIRVTKSGITRVGQIAPRVFDDLNSNGRFDAEDKPVSGAQFIVENTSRSESGDESGVTYIGGLSTGRFVDAELKSSSLDDPFLTPRESARTMTLRPGQVLSFDVPLAMRGDAEGTLLIRNKQSTTPLAGVSIEALNSVGQIVATAKTEYDGYFYFADLPTGRVTLRVNEQQAESIGGSQASASTTIELSRQEPSVFDVQLFIDN